MSWFRQTTRAASIYTWHSPLSTLIHQTHPASFKVYLNCRNLQSLPLSASATTSLRQCSHMFFKPHPPLQYRYVNISAGSDESGALDTKLYLCLAAVITFSNGSCLTGIFFFFLSSARCFAGRQSSQSISAPWTAIQSRLAAFFCLNHLTLLP